MYYALAGALLVTAGVVVWLSSLLGVAGLLAALVLALCTLIAIALIAWTKNREEHLYEERPRIVEIRKPLTPANYTVRSNMDPPFFSFESQNYGTPRPRTRIKNVPIDHYLELQGQIEKLTNSIELLSEQLAQAKAEITVIDAEGQKVEAPTLLVRDVISEPDHEAEAAQAKPQPLVDTTITKAAKKTWRTPSRSLTKIADSASDEPKRKSPRPPSYVLEIIANTQKQYSRLWRRN